MHKTMMILPVEKGNLIKCLNKCPSSGERNVAVPHKVPLQWSKLDVPYGCPSCGKGYHYEVPFGMLSLQDSVPKGALSSRENEMQSCRAPLQLRKHDKCPIR